MAIDQKAEPTMKELYMKMKQFHEAYYVNNHSTSDWEVAMIARDSDGDSSTEAPRNHRMGGLRALKNMPEQYIQASKGPGEETKVKEYSTSPWTLYEF